MYVLLPLDEALPAVGPFETRGDAIAYAERADVYDVEGYYVRVIDAPEES